MVLNVIVLIRFFYTTQVTDIKNGIYFTKSTVCVGDTAQFIKHPNLKILSQQVGCIRVIVFFSIRFFQNIENDTLFYIFNKRDISEVIVVGQDMYGCTDTARIPGESISASSKLLC
jgi:hypothetical protein